MKPRFLITSGPTREFIDPVRFISNASSGRMGFALAGAAREKGFPVTVISGPSEAGMPRGIKCLPAGSAREMFFALKKSLGSFDIIIGAAAVADFRPKKVSAKKIKKNRAVLTLELVKNPDILQYAGAHKGKRVVIGFALESDNLSGNAKKKLKEKNLDLIVANSPRAIGSERTGACMFFEGGKSSCFRDISKKRLAKRIIDEGVRIWKARQAD